MQSINGLFSRVRVRGVYAADTYAVVLVDQHGRSLTDDLVVRLIGWRANEIEREIDPPLLTERCWPTVTRTVVMDGEEMEIEESQAFGPGPCPEGRAAAQRIVQRASAIYAYAPIGGDGFLESLSAGQPVAGEILVGDDPRIPIHTLLGDHLVRSN